MGFGGGYHGSSSEVVTFNWDDMNLEQKASYLEEQRKMLEKHKNYEKRAHNKKITKYIFLGILTIVLVVVVVLIVRACFQ